MYSPAIRTSSLRIKRADVIHRVHELYDTVHSPSILARIVSPKCRMHVYDNSKHKHEHLQGVPQISEYFKEFDRRMIFRAPCRVGPRVTVGGMDTFEYHDDEDGLCPVASCSIGWQSIDRDGHSWSGTDRMVFSEYGSCNVLMVSDIDRHMTNGEY